MHTVFFSYINYKGKIAGAQNARKYSVCGVYDYVVVVCI